MLKKTVFVGIILSINIAMFELVAFGFYKFKYGDYSSKSINSLRQDVVNQTNVGLAKWEQGTQETQQAEALERREIIHPYIGYATEGIKVDLDCLANFDDQASYQCRERVLLQDDSPMPKRSPDTLNVAVLGGSVAQATVTGGAPDIWHFLLSRLPEYKGRQVIVHALAGGGYKQPQTLMMLNYYMSLGAEYDLIVAIDGFNEIAITGTEFKRNGIHPSFPRSWNGRVAEKVSPKQLKLYAQQARLEENHKARSSIFALPILNKSVTFNLIWTVFNSNYQRESARIADALNFDNTDGDIPREFQLEKLGPLYEFSSWDDLYDYSANVWANATIAANAIAVGTGAQFFSFIQPNQYIEGAKPLMSDRERAVALIDPKSGKSGYGFWYKKGYPFLKEQQQRMIEKGVKSYDLTYLYKDMPDEIYIDSCCHMNPKGNDLITNAVVQKIHEYNISQK